jgi:hypothetical protein
LADIDCCLPQRRPKFRRNVMPGAGNLGGINFDRLMCGEAIPTPRIPAKRAISVAANIAHYAPYFVAHSVQILGAICQG